MKRKKKWVSAVPMRKSFPMTLFLRSCKNPDFFPNDTTKILEEVAEVTSTSQAVAICMAWIEKHNLGAGNWRGGEVFRNEELIATISYNGRIV